MKNSWTIAEHDDCSSWMILLWQDTVLHRAIHSGSEESVSLLLDHQAQLEAWIFFKINFAGCRHQEWKIFSWHRHLERLNSTPSFQATRASDEQTPLQLSILEGCDLSAASPLWSMSYKLVLAFSCYGPEKVFATPFNLDLSEQVSYC